MAIKIKHYIFHPLLKTFVFITTIYLILFSMVMADHFDFKIKEVAIENSMKKIINEDCRDAFISWAIYDQTPFSDQYIFDDVIGCLDKSKPECASSLKGLNKYWQSSHTVDPISYVFLNSFQEDEVRHFNNIEDLNKYTSIYKAIKSSNKNVVKISLSAVKKHILINGIRAKVVYVFSLAHTDRATNACSNKVIEQRLKELYRKAKK